MIEKPVLRAEVNPTTAEDLFDKAIKGINNIAKYIFPLSIICNRIVCI
jgi:hypothetical protein